ncbi:hypothetical protein CHARACLAT_015327 [Characodon lateralis]|uniref:Uncharacterized protein n=1 Tax=Characodon lateralis TaxID=208331 RepID=A0ABU7DGU2_9TELE|nr:hypothetical protein [Characodon lateralis]
MSSSYLTPVRHHWSRDPETLDQLHAYLLLIFKQRAGVISGCWASDKQVTRIWPGCFTKSLGHNLACLGAALMGPLSLNLAT